MLIYVLHFFLISKKFYKSSKLSLRPLCLLTWKGFKTWKRCVIRKDTPIPSTDVFSNTLLQIPKIFGNWFFCHTPCLNKKIAAENFSWKFPFWNEKFANSRNFEFFFNQFFEKSQNFYDTPLTYLSPYERLAWDIVAFVSPLCCFKNVMRNFCLDIMFDIPE